MFSGRSFRGRARCPIAPQAEQRSTAARSGHRALPSGFQPNFLPMAQQLCYPVAVIQRLARLMLLLLFVMGVASCALADTFELSDGSKLSGEAIWGSANAQGIVIKKEDGSYAPRTGWTNFTVNTLKQLSQNPKAKQFVDPFLEAVDDEAISAKKAAQEIVLKPVPRIERPDPRAGFGALFRSPLSIVLLLIVYLANLYAAFEISIFKNYPAAAVCSAAAVVPFVGPALFLCLPRRMPGVKQEELPEQLAEEHQAQHVVTQEQEVHETPAPAPAGHEKPTLPPPTVYQRGHFSFNRRFFETKMPGFLRVVPSESEKDMLIFVKSSRGEHVASRISRLTPNEIYFHVIKGGASSEVMIPYTELAEIQVRHKDLA